MGHHHDFDKNSRRLGFAILINILLTVVQIVGGILSGSLSLIADALHNFSDAGALLIAVIARKVGNKPADSQLSYGYKRAEIIGALINSTSLVIVGLYLCYEAITRYFNPEPIDGWVVVWVAGFALIVDVATAILTYLSGGKDNLNIRAAFIHNLSDALASVAVIIAGSLIILFQLYIVDVVCTVLISGYVIYHGISLLRQSIRILMQAVPDSLDLDEVKEHLKTIDGVKAADHIHLWQLDDERTFFEGHLLVEKGIDFSEITEVIRAALVGKFQIDHSTIELKWDTGVDLSPQRG